MIVPVLIGAASLCLLLLVRHLRKNQGKLDHLGIPVLPNPWNLGSAPFAMHKHTMHELILERHKKYGKTFGRYDGVTPVISTIDPELVKSITVKNFDSFTGTFDFDVSTHTYYRYIYIYTHKLKDSLHVQDQLGFY